MSRLINITGVTGSNPYQLTVTDSSNIAINDYISDSTGDIYRVINIPSPTLIDIQDDVAPDAPEGTPATGNGSAFAPTPYAKISQPPFNTPQWDEIIRRDFRRVDDQFPRPSNTTPAILTFPALPGTSSEYARGDHNHAHGNLAGGTTHALATQTTAGFMSETDKTILDTSLTINDEATQIGTGVKKLKFVGSEIQAQIDPMDSTQAIISVTASAGGTGIEIKDDSLSLGNKTKLNIIGPGLAATIDGYDGYQVNVSVLTAVPVTISSANAQGAADSLARSDHVHAHGNLGGGSSHSIATPSTAGFMSSVDKSTLDALAGGAFSLPVRNESGMTIQRGRAVVITGYDLGLNAYLIELADKDNPMLRPSNGLTSDNIPNNTDGEIISIGILEGIDTSAFTITDQLVLSNDGYLSRPPPDTDPFTGEVQDLATVIRVDAVDGALQVLAQGLSTTDGYEVFALSGTNGTPSNTNRYVTNSDPRNTNTRTPTAHAITHLPGGSDALTTAAAVTLNANSSNTAGIASSFSRSDHTHDLDTGVASAWAFGAANSEGSSANLVRADHSHGVGIPSSPVDVNKGASSAGTSTAPARADHKHDISTAAAGAILIGDGVSEGSSASLARADHVHSVAAPAAPVNITKAAASAGISTSPARADHKHDIDTAAPATTGVGTTSLEGTATTLARSDHTHQSSTIPANITKAAAAIGTSGEPARADHKHDISTAAPSQGIGGSNSEGTSTSLVRADHDHTIRETGGPTNLTVAAIAVNDLIGRVGTTLRGMSVSGDQPIVAGLTINEDFQLAGDLTPVVLDAYQNDYNPTGLATASVLRLTSNDGYNITGLQGGTDGRLILVLNVGTNFITLTTESTNSSAANRFSFPSNQQIVPGAGILLCYDSTSLRWRSTSLVSLSSIAPVTSTKSAAVIGTSSMVARADHKHDIATAAPTTNIGSNTINNDGYATTLSRSDHMHKVTLSTFEATTTADTTTTSTTDVLMAGMTLTPGPGDYLAMFSTTLENTNNGQTVTCSLYANGAQVTHTERSMITTGGDKKPVALHTAIINLIGSGQTVEIRWRVSANTGTAHQRTFTLLRIN